MSARVFVSALASGTYDKNATKRPSALIDADAASTARALRLPCAIVTNDAAPSAGTRPANPSDPSANAATRRSRSELAAPAASEKFAGHLAARCDRALRFEAGRPGQPADAGTRSRRHRREIHAVELLQDVFEFMGQKRDGVS